MPRSPHMAQALRCLPFRTATRVGGVREAALPVAGVARRSCGVRRWSGAWSGKLSMVRWRVEEEVRRRVVGVRRGRVLGVVWRSSCGRRLRVLREGGRGTRFSTRFSTRFYTRFSARFARVVVMASVVEGEGGFEARSSIVLRVSWERGRARWRSSWGVTSFIFQNSVGDID